MKPLFIVLVIITALYSCKKTTSLPEYNSDPVVTAYLTAGLPPNVKLSHQESTSSVTFISPSLDSLDMTIRCGDSIYHLFSIGDGSYTNTNILINEGLQYDLSFTYNGKNVTASAIVPTKPVDVTQSATSISIEKITSTTTQGFGGPGSMPEPISITWSNSDASYYVTVVENLETNPERIIDTSSTFTDTGRVFRNSPITNGTYELNSRSFKYFGKHRITLYHIRPDYALLYDNSTSSSQSLSTPSTGITNGVGIFTAINADTLYLQVTKQ